MICPSCKQDAPTIVRGVRAYCTACGAPRAITEGNAVNVAGQPSKVGGTVAKVFGWLVLLGGLGMAAIVGALFQAILPGGVVGFVLGGVIAALALTVGIALLVGGKKLEKSGDARARAVEEQAVFALAARNRGSVTVRELARALEIPEATADELLTSLAKRPDGRVTLEIDEDGTLRYTVPELVRIARPGSRVRVGPTGQRVDATDDDALAEEEARDEKKTGRRREL